MLRGMRVNDAHITYDLSAPIADVVAVGEEPWPVYLPVVDLRQRIGLLIELLFKQMALCTIRVPREAELCQIQLDLQELVGSYILEADKKWQEHIHVCGPVFKHLQYKKAYFRAESRTGVL